VVTTSLAAPLLSNMSSAKPKSPASPGCLGNHSSSTATLVKCISPSSLPTQELQTAHGFEGSTFKHCYHWCLGVGCCACKLQDDLRRMIRRCRFSVKILSLPSSASHPQQDRFHVVWVRFTGLGVHKHHRIQGEPFISYGKMRGIFAVDISIPSR
jgi:hypothetical protein